MQDVFTAGDRSRPAGVAFEISGNERQAITRLGAALPQQCAHVALAPEIADRGAHLMAGGQKLQDAMAADEARPAGDQNCAHRCLPFCALPTCLERHMSAT